MKYEEGTKCTTQSRKHKIKIIICPERTETHKHIIYSEDNFDNTTNYSKRCATMSVWSQGHFSVLRQVSDLGYYHNGSFKPKMINNT